MACRLGHGERSSQNWLLMRCDEAGGMVRGKADRESLRGN